MVVLDLRIITFRGTAMRRILFLTAVLCAAAQSVSAQTHAYTYPQNRPPAASPGYPAPMYDPSYTGRTTGQALPTFTPMQPARPNQPPPPTGIIPSVGNGLWNAGSFLWSFMPAPLQGGPNPYVVGPDQGHVITNFTPGNP
jgi:hypothetical protein